MPRAPAAPLTHALADDYLEFVAARCRPNALLAAAYEPEGLLLGGVQGARCLRAFG
ncbi:hypothetical protein AB0I10_05470 [Streptomyces sp. NPDC050636]|uniref:hypothetical protein n=1 Tax=Streptomyces sp. NPDC050636 TaxID=3154510 RepID=UPI003444AEEC